MDTPPVSPLRIEQRRTQLTCRNNAMNKELIRPRDWSKFFRKFKRQILQDCDFRRNVDFDEFDARGWNGLHAAVILNDFELVKALISTGVSAHVASHSGWTIFHYATRHPQMIQGLMELLGLSREPSPAPSDFDEESE